MDSITNHPEVLSVIVALPLFGVLAKLFGATFKKISKWYLYIAVFAIVIVLNSTFFPFIGGKDYFFRFTVELALIFFLLSWAFEMTNDELKTTLRAAFKKPLVIAVSLFVLIFLLACIFAVDTNAAFWSNYERGEGGFQMIHYYLFFILLVLLLQTEDDWKNIFRFSLVAAVLMIFYGLLGNFSSSLTGNSLLRGFVGPYAGGGAPDNWWHKLVDGRFQGSLGNPAYVAPYLLFSMFYATYLFVSRKLEAKSAKLMGIGYGVLMAVFLFAFLISQTRGAFLGLVAAIYIFLVYLGHRERRYRKLSIILLAVAIVLGGLAVHYVRQEYHFNPQGPLSIIPGIRLFDLPLSDSVLVVFGLTAFIAAFIIQFAKSKKLLWQGLAVLLVLLASGAMYAKSTNRLPSFADPTTSTRFWVWGEAWSGFLERPILGWGPENFTAIYDKYFNPLFFVPGQNTETWYDRAHSVYFDYLSQTGALGLVAYLSIFFVFAREFFRRRGANAEARPSGERSHVHSIERGLMLSLPVAYLIQGVAIFDVLPMYINLFVFTAFAQYYFNQRHGQNR